MKRLYLLFIALSFHYFTQSQSSYWQQKLHYVIDVTLNDKEHDLDGFLKLQYINNSPDTLKFIWFHLWPNAFKNDQTAFSEQLLQNGRTDFYFSDKEKRGYINRLDFKTDNTTLETEDHPSYIDVVKVYLSKPLPPGAATEITTPFHVKLPANFSRGGHKGQSYQVTQWYPKPAVYDHKGWHPMPYLDQGEFYSEFGSYDVRITLPENYVVAATGELQSEEEKNWMRSRKTEARNPKPVTKQETDHSLKTVQYKQSDVHDFAWFADKAFTVLYDTIQLASGRVAEAWSFYKTDEDGSWKNSLSYIKDAVRFRSMLIGEYPYNTVSVVQANMGFTGGMEYPAITSISPALKEKELDITIEHEIGHNWFYGILASNEREYPWMDEGLNTYYDNRYEEWKYPEENRTVRERAFSGFQVQLVDALAKQKKDQPIATPSVQFTELNYGVIAYTKTAAWLKDLETYMGKERFDAAMQEYFRQWQFKHPYPENFQQVMEQMAGKDLDEQFAALHTKGPVNPGPGKIKLRSGFRFPFNGYERNQYINWLPAIGYNKYDQFMAGLLFHNYNLPRHNFQFALSPLYATGSKQLNGIGDISYTWYPDSRFQKIQLGLGGARFATMDGIDSTGTKLFGGFYKLTPSIRFTFKNASPRSTLEKWIEWKTYIIGEKGFEYKLSSIDSMFHPIEGAFQQRYLNQLTFGITDCRALYPYNWQWQLQQGDGFYRATGTANYFFNYAKGGGLRVRLFAAKFGYLGERTFEKEISVSRYLPKITGVNGNEDYTYSNYFFGRNEFEGFASQQVMIRDGGLKIRSDLFQEPQLYTENWMAAINFNTTLPEKLFPVKIPLRLYLDIGTMAEYWKKESNTSRFLFVGGLQLSLLKDLLHFYAPIIYSREFRDNLLTVPEENKFFQRLSFSIDIHRFNLRKVTNNKFPF